MEYCGLGYRFFFSRLWGQARYTADKGRRQPLLGNTYYVHMFLAASLNGPSVPALKNIVLRINVDSVWPYTR